MEMLLTGFLDRFGLLEHEMNVTNKQITSTAGKKDLFIFKNFLFKDKTKYRLEF